MAIRSDEIISIIKSQIADFDSTTETRSVGTVVEVGDGIAQVYGLDAALSSELLEFPGGVMGMALNLEEETVGAVILGDATAIKEGDTVRTTGRVVEVPVGAALLGRVVDPLGNALDGKGDKPPLNLVSVYTDQVPDDDVSRELAGPTGFTNYDRIADALTVGTGRLAVDGVFLVAEHGKYPETDTGQFAYPKRRMFDEIVNVFRESGKVVPVYLDKHLSDNWDDAKWIYDTAREMKIPLMAGSSVPVGWRYPATDLRRGAKVKEIVAVSPILSAATLLVMATVGATVTIA